MTKALKGLNMEHTKGPAGIPTMEDQQGRKVFAGYRDKTAKANARAFGLEFLEALKECLGAMAGGQKAKTLKAWPAQPSGKHGGKHE